MDKKELKELADYLDKLGDNIPNGLWHLKDAVNFACIEIRMYIRFGRSTSTIKKAITFAKSIPKHDNLECDEITTWMLKDKKYLKFYP